VALVLADAFGEALAFGDALTFGATAGLAELDAAGEAELEAAGLGSIVGAGVFVTVILSGDGVGVMVAVYFPRSQTK